LALSRLLQNLIFEVSPFDPLTFVSVGCSIVIVAMLACYLPAQRATRSDPMTALRSE
jgi:ABC-type lipoprotein release transport system permease subunit